MTTLILKFLQGEYDRHDIKVIRRIRLNLAKKGENKTKLVEVRPNE